METLLDYVKSNGHANLPGEKWFDENGNQYLITNVSRHAMHKDAFINIQYLNRISIYQPLKDHYNDTLEKQTTELS